MGLFSGKTIYSSSVSVSPLFNKFPNIIRDAVLSSVSNNTNMADNLLLAQVNNYSNKSKKMIRYLKKNLNSYIPKKSIRFRSLDPEIILQAIKTRHGLTDTSTIDLRGYDYDYIDSYTAVEYLRQKGTKIGEVHTASIVGHRLYVVIKELNPFASTMSIPGQSTTSKGYILVNKKYNNPFPYRLVYTFVYSLNGVSKLWVYDPSTNVYPELSPSNIESPDTYMPVIPIRTNKRNINSNKGSEAYIHGKEALGIMGIDFNSLSKSINTNPGIRDIDDAMVVFSIGLHTKEKASIDYLYRFFKKELGAITTNYLQEQVISVRSGEYNVETTWESITETVVTGSIGPVSFVKSSVVVLPQLVTYTPFENNLLPAALRGTRTTKEQSYINLYKQITPTTYSVVKVVGIAQSTTVHRKAGPVIKKLKDEDGSMSIPLDLEILKGMNGIDESYVLFDSANLVIYGVKKQKLKWYQSSFFSVLIKFAAIVYAAYTGQFQALSAVSSVTQVLIAIGKFVIKGLITKKVGSYLSEKLGILGSLLLAVASFAYGNASNIFEGNLGNIPWAEELMKAVTSLTSSFKQKLAGDVQALQNDVSEFASFASKKQKELLEAEDSLVSDNTNIFDPLYANNILSTQTESPSDFYTRTIHTTNPGVLSLDVIPTYVDNTLDLSQLQLT